MSVVDPNTASEATGGAVEVPEVPEFPVVLRGYDRQLVDSRVGRMAEQLAQERRQRAEAERALERLRQGQEHGNALVVQEPATSLAGLGRRAAKVFEEAGAVAERLIEEAGQQARGIVAAAQAEVAQRLAAAEEQADEVKRAAEATLTAAQAERARIETEAAEAAEALVDQARRDAQTELAVARRDIKVARQRAERERQLLEGETQRLESLRQLLAEQLGQVHSHLGMALRAVGDDLERDDFVGDDVVAHDLVGDDVEGDDLVPVGGDVEGDTSTSDELQDEAGQPVAAQQAAPPAARTADE